MSRTLFLFTSLVALSTTFVLSGCGGGDSSADGDDAKKIAEALAKLSDEDRKLAEAQKTCPIGGGPLGGMGTPIKLDVKGQPVFICCDGCKGAVTDDPDGTLAKLKKN